MISRSLTSVREVKRGQDEPGRIVYAPSFQELFGNFLGIYDHDWVSEDAEVDDITLATEGQASGWRETRLRYRKYAAILHR